jgi:hypothetical protein
VIFCCISLDWKQQTAATGESTVYRALGINLIFASLLVLGLTGCPQRGKLEPISEEPKKQAPVDANLVLLLPATAQPPEWAPKRVPQLTINGKDDPFQPGKWDTEEELAVKVTVTDPAKPVTIVYSFWPVSYSNTIRTKEIKLDGDKKVTVDFRKEDPEKPDLIKPIFFPTPPEVVDKMCEMGEVGKDDVVFDIGCGDGRMVIAGVKKFGAKKGVGIDIDPDLVKQCQRKAADAGVTDKVEFRNEDALKIKDVSEATVVLLYVGNDFGAKLEPVLRKTLKPGSRVVSHRFKLGDWEPDVEKKITAKNNYGNDEEYILKLWRVK